MNARAVLSTAIVAASISVPCDGAEVLLRWKPADGANFQVTLTQAIKTETSVGKRVDAISFRSEMEMDWKVDRVDEDDSIHLTQTYKRFRLESDAPDANPFVYDSSSADPLPEEAKPLARAMRPLIGIQTSLVLSNRGELLDAVRPPETESLLGDLPSTNLWRQLLTKEGMHRVLQQALGQLPESPIDVGDSWNQSIQRDSPLGPIRIDSTYTYERTVHRGDRDLEQIRGVTKTKLAEQDAHAQSATRLRHQPQPSVYLFDSGAGFLAESHVTQAVGTEIPYGDSRIRVKTSGTITLKLGPHQVAATEPTR